jgi:hypothetical protein
MGYTALTHAALAAGDVETAREASEAAWQRISFQALSAAAFRPHMATVALLAGDLTEAYRWADEAAADSTGWHLASGLVTRSRAALAQGDSERARYDAQDAIACAVDSGAFLAVADALECLACAVCGAEAARYFGAAEAYRELKGIVRFQSYPDLYEASVAGLRETLGDNDFETAWAEGHALARGDDRLRATRPRRTQTRQQRLGLADPGRAGRRKTGQ